MFGGRNPSAKPAIPNRSRITHCRQGHIETVFILFRSNKVIGALAETVKRSVKQRAPIHQWVIFICSMSRLFLISRRHHSRAEAGWLAGVLVAAVALAGRGLVAEGGTHVADGHGRSSSYSYTEKLKSSCCIYGDRRIELINYRLKIL
jgi:hypothetical protein